MNWIGADWESIVRISVSAMCILAAVVTLIRLNGLRSLSKMSSFDFAVTVAVGSIVATTVLSDSTSLADGAVGVAALLLSQRIVSVARVRIGASRLVDNSPVLLMIGENMLEQALLDTRVTEDDIRAKLREANVTDMARVKAVILESTGDISVLHGDANDGIDARLVQDVIGGWQLAHHDGKGSEGLQGNDTREHRLT